MNAAPSDALVFFGATGDLVFNKIFPALYAMERRGSLRVPVIGIARSDWSIEQFRARARASVDKHGSFDETVFARLQERLRYLSGDYGASATHAALRKELGAAAHPLHYLAIPPSVFASVVEGLGQSGCARGARNQRIGPRAGGHHQDDRHHSRRRPQPHPLSGNRSE